MTTTIWRSATDAAGNRKVCTFDVTVLCGLQLPGDANQDGSVGLSDAVLLPDHLFLGRHPTLPCEGRTAGDPADAELELLDFNGDRTLGLSDAVGILRWLFQGGRLHVLGVECRVIVGCPSVCGR